MNDRGGRNNDTDNGGRRDVADQITPSRHSHRHIDCEAEPGLESTNRTAAFTSSKRKLARDPEEDGDEQDYDYDTPKGPSNATPRDTPTHSLGVPTPQYAKGTANSSPKRIRSNEWLLRSREASPGHTAGGMKDSTPRLRSRRRQSAGKSSAIYHHHGSRSASGFISPSADGERRSRFLEGSMNDRVSQKPPSIYIGDDVEDALDRYVTGDEGESGDNRGGSVSTTGTGSRYGHAHSGSIANSMSSVATDTPSAKSGLVRFGQAIVSAFNPFGVWSNVSDIWNGPQDGTKASTATVSSTDILDERRAQAEKAYAELKASGYKGTAKTVSANPSGGGGVTPSGKEKKVKTIKKQQSMMTTPHKHNRSISSTFSKENLFTPSKSAIRASFQDLRKAASYINISTPSLVSKRGGQESVDDDRDAGAGAVAGDADSSILCKQASRKELVKQKKLRKKVSNLESRLEKARKELNRISGDGSEVGDDGNGIGNGNGIRDAEMAWNEHLKASEEEREEKESIAPIPPPHTSGLHTGVVRKKKFVPGALPSLPSERVLLGQAAAAEEKSTNRSMLNKGAVDHQRLRKGRREGSQDLTAASRHGEDKYSAARMRGGGGGDGEKYPDASLGASTAYKHGTARKVKLQRHTASSVKVEDTTIPPPTKTTDYDYDNENETESHNPHPHPNPIGPKTKTKSKPPRRRSSTTFPPENEDPLTSKSNRTHSHSHSNGAGADEEDMMMVAEDVPPVPPLPASFVAGTNSRRRREMRSKMGGEEVEGGSRKGVGEGREGRLRRVGKEVVKEKENVDGVGRGSEGFDWPEDFL
ncbi:hypothetical protein FQN50_003385 [Emmonsiellopsis sp. PD_5]|nr:hypothetical protein FQN50_003385 [Emmonsiellopsis sp. PD_5]